MYTARRNLWQMRERAWIELPGHPKESDQLLEDGVFRTLARPLMQIIQGASDGTGGPHPDRVLYMYHTLSTCPALPKKPAQSRLPESLNENGVTALGLMSGFASFIITLMILTKCPIHWVALSAGVSRLYPCFMVDAKAFKIFRR